MSKSRFCCIKNHLQIHVNASLYDMDDESVHAHYSAGLSAPSNAQSRLSPHSCAALSNRTVHLAFVGLDVSPRTAQGDFGSAKSTLRPSNATSLSIARISVAASACPGHERGPMPNGANVSGLATMPSCTRTAQIRLGTPRQRAQAQYAGDTTRTSHARRLQQFHEDSAHAYRKAGTRLDESFRPKLHVERAVRELERGLGVDEVR